MWPPVSSPTPNRPVKSPVYSMSRRFQWRELPVEVLLPIGKVSSTHLPADGNIFRSVSFKGISFSYSCIRFLLSQQTIAVLHLKGSTNTSKTRLWSNGLVKICTWFKVMKACRESRGMCASAWWGVLTTGEARWGRPARLCYWQWLPLFQRDEIPNSCSTMSLMGCQSGLAMSLPSNI